MIEEYTCGMLSTVICRNYICMIRCDTEKKLYWLLQSLEICMMILLYILHSGIIDGGYD